MIHVVAINMVKNMKITFSKNFRKPQNIKMHITDLTDYVSK